MNNFLIIIIVITIVLILLKRVNHKGNIIDKFSSGDLASSNQEIAIRDTINDLVNRRFSNLYLEEIDASESSVLEDLDDIRTFDLGHDSPLGMISYFYDDPNPPNQICWIECNGETIQRRDYPQFFNMLVRAVDIHNKISILADFERFKFLAFCSDFKKL